MEQIPIGAVGTMLGIDPGDIANALKDGENFVAGEQIGERLKGVLSEKVLKGATKQAHDMGHSRAMKTVLSEAERSLRQTFEIPDDVAGDFQALLKHASESSKTKAPDLKPDDVRKHPAYLEDFSKTRQAITQLKEENTRMAESTRKELALYGLLKGAPTALAKAGFFVADDPTIQANHFGLLLNIMEQGGKVQIRKNDSGEQIPWDVETGEQLKSDQPPYKTITLAELAVATAGSVFAKTGGKNPGPGDQTPKPGESTTDVTQGEDFPATASEEDYQKNLWAMRENGTKPEKREAYMKYVEKLRQAGKLK